MTYLAYTAIFLATGVASGNSPGLVDAYNNRVAGNTELTITQPPTWCFGGLSWKNSHYIGERVLVYKVRDGKIFEVMVVDAAQEKHRGIMERNGIAMDVWGCPELWGEDVVVYALERK